MARIGKRLNPSHYAASNAYNSPFGIGHHYGSLGGLGGSSNLLLNYALIGAAVGAGYSAATKKIEMTESALYGAAIGALLALLMGNKNGSAVIAEEVVIASNGGGNGGLSPSKADLEAAVQLTEESPGSCPDGMILIPANDGTGELVCAPIDTGLPEITWKEQQPFADKIAIGPITSMTDLSRADLGPVHRKTTGYHPGQMSVPIHSY